MKHFNLFKKRLDKKKLYCLIISIFVTFWIMPINSNAASIGRHTLDSSWRIGLNWGDLLGLEFGKDIVFTYGPAYFLSGDVLLNINKATYLFGNILSIILWFMAILLFVTNITERLKFKDIKSNVLSFVIVVISFFSLFFIHIELCNLLLILCLLLIFNICIKKYSKAINILWITCIGFLLALISLNKFYFVAASLSLIILAVIIFLIIKKYWNIFYLLLSYIGFLLVIWFILEKSLKNIILYFKNGIVISSGYSEYMNFHPAGGDKYIILFAFFILLLWACIFIFGLIKKNKKIMIYFLLSLPLLFLIYKEGFTRQDSGHLPIYFSFIIYILIITISIFGKKIWKIFPIFLILIVFSVSYTKIDFNIGSKIPGNCQEIATFSKAFLPGYDDEYENKLEEDKRIIRNKKPMDDHILNLIDAEDKVSVIPWEVYIPYVYDLNWSPRPVFQSYTAYKPGLDDMNSEHFTGDNAPDKIIYRIDSIDERYAIFDEPATFREIIKNYDFFYAGSNEFGVLEKKKGECEFQKEIIISDTANIGEIIELPKIDKGYLFCKMDIKLNLEGKVRNLLYRGDYLYIEFFFNDFKKETVIKRFIRENGQNGFFVSKYIDNIFDLKEVFDCQKDFNSINDIKSIRITASNDTYCNEFDIEFYNLKISN